MSVIYYGITDNLERNYEKWARVSGTPDVFAEKESDLHKSRTGLLEAFDVVSIDEALLRYPDAEIWITYSSCKSTANMLLKKVTSDRIHFLNSDLEYRKGCGYLGNFISYRMDTFSPCCITGKAPIIKTSGSIQQRLLQWQEYITQLVDDVRNEKPTKCDQCHHLQYGFWPKTVKLNRINLGSNNPGDICNFRCTYCFCEKTFSRIKDMTDGLSTYEILRQLAEMPEYNNKSFIVQLANGEFCANRHCNEMLDMFLQTKWTIDLLSNFSIYKEKLATLMADGRVRRLVVSLDAGTRETFDKIKQVDQFNRVVENLKRYPVNRTNLSLKYIFLEGVNDNEDDINGFYEIAKEIGAAITWSANMNLLYTAKMRELALMIIERAKRDGMKFDMGSSYLNPKDAKFLKESYTAYAK